MTEEEEDKAAVEVWKPTNDFPTGTDLVPDLKPGGVELVKSPDELLGRENVDPDDVRLPSLLLLQGQSDPVTDQVEGAQPGKFWLSSAGQVIQPPLRVFIVHHSRSRALFPRENSPSAGLMKCLARDGLVGTEYGVCDECQYKKWGENNEKPACAESHNFVCWTPYGPAVLRLTKSSYKAARNFLTTWTMSSKNLWAHPCIVTVKANMKQLSDGSKSTYFTMDLRWDQREDVPPAFQKSAVDIYRQVQEAHEGGRLTSDNEEAAYHE